MSSRRKVSCKTVRKVATSLPFTGLPGVPVCEGFFYTNEDNNNYQTPGIRSRTQEVLQEVESADNESSPRGRTQDVRDDAGSHQNVERTESLVQRTPGFRKGHRKPVAFIQQKEENGNTQEEDGKAAEGVSSAIGGNEKNQKGELKKQNSEAEKQRETQSCTDNKKDGCSGRKDRKSVAVNTRTSAEKDKEGVEFLKFLFCVFLGLAFSAFLSVLVLKACAVALAFKFSFAGEYELSCVIFGCFCCVAAGVAGAALLLEQNEGKDQ